MTASVYERLAEALDRLPNRFPRTQSGVEIAILQKIFSIEEASLASELGRKMETYNVIAERLELRAEEVKSRLIDMSKRGLVWSDERDGKPRFRLAPFVVGIYEAQLDAMNHELAHLVEDYFEEGGIVGIMRPQPAIHRVIPSRKAVKSEWILPYDDVKAILLASKTFRVRDCICRVQQDYVGRKCDFPLKTCLSFSSIERPPRLGDISLEEALGVLDKAEDIGLVHTVSNVMKGIGYVCNCCGCCCGILRGITEFDVKDSVAHANYYAIIDPDSCLGCGTCIERCQVQAICKRDGVAVVNREQCIGCGLCVTGCPNDVAKLQRKSADEIVDPPADFNTWEHERLLNRTRKVKA